MRFQERQYQKPLRVWTLSLLLLLMSINKALCSAIPEAPQTSSEITEQPKHYAVMTYHSDRTLPRELLTLTSVESDAERQGIRLTQSLALAIYLLRGRFNLSELTDQVADKHMLHRSASNEIHLHVPLIIHPDAALSIEHQSLKLTSKMPVFIYNLGELKVKGSDIASYDLHRGTRLSLSQHDKAVPWQQRPFIWCTGDSTTLILDSTLSALGQPGLFFASGLTFSAIEPLAQKNLKNWIERQWYSTTVGKPKVSVLNSKIIDNYVGMSAKNADQVELKGNTFKRNLYSHVQLQKVQNILPIQGNVFVSTRWSDGLYIAKTETAVVKDNVFTQNAGNGLSGVSLGEMRVSDNLFVANALNGIQAKHTKSLTAASNVLLGNIRDGLRLDSVFAYQVQENQFRQNGFYGLEIDANSLTPQKLVISGNVVRNIFVENLDAAITTSGLQKSRFVMNLFTGIGSRNLKGALAAESAQFWKLNQSVNGYLHCVNGDLPC